MSITEIIAIGTSIVLPILSGFSSYILSINKSKKDIVQLREQNKLEIEKLMNQHKMDLEALERKHQMDIEKMQLEHNHRIQLMEKETQNKLGGDIIGGMISTVMNTPEVKNQMSRSVLQGMNKKKRINNVGFMYQRRYGKIDFVKYQNGFI
jgi:hypothetical protein